MKKYKKVKITDQYILAEGEVPICLVAHLDTVFKQPPQDIYYDEKQQVLWSPQGLGADDRAGVYAIIQIIEDGYRPSVLFTTDEEIGGGGAQALVSQKPNCPLENLKAIFELDRAGKNDMVFYGCNNEDFEKFLHPYGFEYAYGTFSDISIIAPAWKVAAANLSIGYVGEHFVSEILHTDWMETTIEKVEMLIDSSDVMPYFTYVPKLGNDFFWGKDSCLYCKRKLNKKNRHMVQGTDTYGRYTYYLCDKCFKTEFSV